MLATVTCADTLVAESDMASEPDFFTGNGCLSQEDIEGMIASINRVLDRREGGGLFNDVLSGGSKGKAPTTH
jgi:hypothetical protein